MQAGQVMFRDLRSKFRLVGCLSALPERSAMACRRLAWNLPRLLAAQSRVGVPCAPQWGATVAVQPRRALSLHEHQNMEILKEFGLEVPRGEVAETVEEARAITDRFGGQSVVKAQVLAGGRGKGYFTSGLKGGVQKAESPEEAASFAEQMLGSKLITKQTGNKGKPCNKVLLMELLHPQDEYYVAIVMDRVARGPVLMASREGGVDIEEVADRSPGAITKEYVDPLEGLTKEKAAQVASFLGLSGSYHEQAVDQFMKLYRVFTDKDAIMVEINPMTRDRSGKVICMDAKINFDDNAAYRHPSIHELRDWTQEDHREVEATKAGLNYIGLDGDIGCLVNGAGLAMATLDLIQYHGGKPANFLDIGGSASANEVKNAFQVISGDSNVRAILVNIFGGITKCDEIAEGIISASKMLNLQLPLVVRLQGTNYEEAEKKIAESGLKIHVCGGFSELAKLAMERARGSP